MIKLITSSLHSVYKNKNSCKSLTFFSQLFLFLYSERKEEAIDFTFLPATPGTIIYFCPM